MPHRCYIVPPHLLRAISESSHNSESTRQAARTALASHQNVTAKRKSRIEAVVQSRRDSRPRPTARPYIPSYLLRHISQSADGDDEARAATLRTLEHTLSLETTKEDDKDTSAQPTEETGHPKESPHRSVYDAGHVASETELPGKLVRAEGDKEARDKTVNEAYDNVGTVLKFYKEEFAWNSIDNKNADIVSSVHFGEQYENACKCGPPSEILHRLM